jgi:uncharacterized membrane protein YdbT with pleckstrin-like domain
LTTFQEEKVLARTKLHWAVFIPTVLVGVAVMTPPLLVAMVTHVYFAFLVQMVHAFGPAIIVPTANSFWLAPFILGFLLLLPLALGTLVAYAKSDICLTDRRLILRSGFLSRSSGEIPLENVESTFLTEPLFGRMFGFGSITVTTIGGGTVRLGLIESPQGFYVSLQSAVLKIKGRGAQYMKPPQDQYAMQDDSRYMPK